MKIPARSKRISVHLLAALALAGTLPGCGGDEPATPVAAATPAPSPSPTPTATPSPTTLGCNLAAMPDCSRPEGPRGVFGCCRQDRDQLGEFVELAIRDVQMMNPSLFDGDRLRRPSEFHEVVSLIARRLETRFGLCARPGGPEDEVAVKRSNDFSEQYDVIIGDGTAVNVHGYTVTCRPARF